MGKGDKRRPSTVSWKTYDSNWDRVFEQGRLKRSTEEASVEDVEPGRGCNTPAVHE